MRWRGRPFDERDRLQRIILRLDENLHGPCLCAAIVDGRTFKGTIIETGTDSYSLAHTLQQTG